MARAEAEAEPETNGSVADYKGILAAVLDKRPSGTRVRLAATLGKNRSFISQIANPIYPTPIPVGHIELIFEVCHFSTEERRQFLTAYARAHPRRRVVLAEAHRLKAHVFHLPDLGDEQRNAQMHALVSEFVRKLVGMMDNR
jgi:hypothetical protein